MRGHGSGRAPRNRSHARPPGAKAPAAESAARTTQLLAQLFGHRGVTVTLVAEALGVRELDVARWRRGQPIPAYRRVALEGKLAKLRVVVDEVTGDVRVEG
jgi:hypothetical protein